ncbi:MAG: fluoride efflux transporter CrcB [Cyclonatronaceae bacterium]
MLKDFLLVGLGGALGSMMRYGIGRAGLALQLSCWGFPVATFTVNILGSLLIGVLGGIFQHAFPQIPVGYQLLLVTGFCGGFTTFSTFSNETFALLESGAYVMAGSYVVLSLVIGLLAVWAGYTLGLRWG